jgi:hypothetical protein
LNATERRMGQACKAHLPFGFYKGVFCGYFLLCSFIKLYATIPLSLPVTADVHKHKSFAAEIPRFRSHVAISSAPDTANPSYPT